MRRERGSGGGQFGDGGEKLASVGVARLVKDLLGGADFYKFAGAHDGDASGDLCDDGEAVRDEDVGERKFALELLQKKKDLRADGDVKRGDRLVGDNKTGLKNQGAGDADALPLPAGEFVGIAAQSFVIQADTLKKGSDALETIRAREARFVNRKRLGDDFSNAHAGIQRSEGVLKDHLHPAALGAKRVSAKAAQVVAFETNFAAVRLDETKEHARESGLAAAALTDNREGIAANNGKTHASHGGETGSRRFLREDAAAPPVGFPQFAHDKKRFHHTSTQRAL